jgi:hypothetical protein
LYQVNSDYENIVQMRQMEIFEAREARDQGIAAAADHAEQVNPGWNDQAYDFLKKFIDIRQGPFMAEEVRSYAALIDFPLPPHARAWGGIILRAVKAGLIQQDGTGKVTNVKAHRANAAIWRAIRKTA